MNVQEQVLKRTTEMGKSLFDVLISGDTIVSTKHAQITDAAQLEAHNLLEFCKENRLELFNDSSLSAEDTEDSRNRLIVLLAMVKLKLGRVNEDYFDAYLDMENEENSDALVEYDAKIKLLAIFANVCDICRVLKNHVKVPLT